MFKHTHKPNDATDSDDSQSKEKESEKIESDKKAKGRCGRKI
jgi:hypothetical protein